jgi:hypothetical protein
MSVQPRTATVVIFQGDYLDRIRLLEQKAQAAKDAEGAAPRRVGSTPEYLQIAEEHDALVQEAEASALRIVVKALRRSEWRALVAEHPPREDNKSDASVGVNEDTFREALVPASIIEPVDFTADDLDELSDADYDRIYYTAFGLNRGAVVSPGKANLYSRLSQESDET